MRRSLLRLFALIGLVLPLALASAALAQPQPQVTITSPTNGATVPGPDVTVTIQVTGTTLVPAANATKLDDLHVHYLLDVDPAPYLDGTTPIPTGNPHQVTVILGQSDHRAVQPPVAPSVSFTVAGAQAAAPSQLPRTGDGSTATTAVPLAGIAAIALLAVVLLGAARLVLGHRR
jgi:hypothetical protein